MAITFPRELPSYHVSECWFQLDDNTSLSVTRNNAINLSQIVPEAWTCNIVTGLLQTPIAAKWSSWKKSLRGGLRMFVAYDTRCSTPFAYPNAKEPGDIQIGWDGTVDVSSVGLSGALGLSGLPTAYQFKEGDRIGLEQNGYYGYYEVLEDVTAAAGSATVTVSPFLHSTIFTTAAVARIWRPKCQFVIDWQSWQENGKKEPGALSFKGYQRL